VQKDNIHWYCVGCNKGVGKLLTMLSKVQTNQDCMEKGLTELREKVDKTNKEVQQQINSREKCVNEIKGELDTVRGVVESQTQEIIVIREAIKELTDNQQIQRDEQKKLVSDDDSAWSAIVSKHVEKKIENVKQEMHKMQTTVLEAESHIVEEREREKRKNNIIIYRMEESKAVSAEERKNDDMDFLRVLIGDVLDVECRDCDIHSVLRLGKREADGCRPVLIGFKTSAMKNVVTESLGHLAEAAGKYRILSITHDMTKRDREECKKMVMEAKSQQAHETSGEWMYRVRGAPGEMKIIRLKKRV
jgi:plastocyanin